MVRIAGKEFNFWSGSLEKQNQDLEKKLYSNLTTNIMLIKRLESNAILQSYCRRTDKPIELRMEALMHLVDVNIVFLEPRESERVIMVNMLWYRILARTWSGSWWPRLQVRRKTPIYDNSVGSLEIFEDNVAKTVEKHLFPIAFHIVGASVGQKQITPEFINIMKSPPPMMSMMGGGGLLDLGDRKSQPKDEAIG